MVPRARIMNIPDEAVTEARRALEREFPYDENNEHIVKLVLEAAAPQLMAAAWDEGKDAVWTFMSNTDPRRDRPSNPYRKRTNAD